MKKILIIFLFILAIGCTGCSSVQKIKVEKEVEGVNGTVLAEIRYCPGEYVDFYLKNHTDSTLILDSRAYLQERRGDGWQWVDSDSKYAYGFVSILYEIQPGENWKDKITGKTTCCRHFLPEGMALKPGQYRYQGTIYPKDAEARKMEFEFEIK